jgi:predicted RNA-binding protein with EMAP domain
MTADFSTTQNEKEFRLFVKSGYSRLIKLKYRGYRESFNQVLLTLTPKIQVYINAAIKKGYLSKDHYNVDDFMSDLFIEIYDHIEEVENEEDFYAWLYETTDGLFPKMNLKVKFNDYFFNTIGDFSRQECVEM